MYRWGVAGRGEGDKLTLKIPLEAVCFLQEGKTFLTFLEVSLRQDWVLLLL